MTNLKPCPFCGSSDVGLEPEWACRYQCNDCGAEAPQCATRDSDDAKASKWNTRVSPWRSLKDDPPEYPAPIGKSILVRRGMGYSWTTSYRWWQHKVLDQEPEKALRHGWKEWMEVPQ